MSVGATILGCYLLLGVLAVTVALARRGAKRFRRLGVEDGTEFSAGVLLAIAVLWPVWAIIEVSRTAHSRATLAPEASDEDEVSATMRSIGRFTPADAKAVLSRLEERKLAFEIGCDTSSPDSNIDGNFYDRPTVEVFVATVAFTQAVEAVEEWRRKVGGLARG